MSLPPKHLEKQGVVDKVGGFNQKKHSEIDLTDNQRIMLSDLVRVIEKTDTAISLTD